MRKIQKTTKKRFNHDHVDFFTQPIGLRKTYIEKEKKIKIYYNGFTYTHKLIGKHCKFFTCFST